MSTSQIYDAVIAVSERRLVTKGKLKHLDIGAGAGRLIRRLREALDVESSACDFHVERFSVEEVKLAQLDLNRDRLPYADENFDLVTCSEVVEHLENYRGVIREMHRILRPGGLAVITTPNVLNANSRLRYLVSGFANLFGPLPVKNDERYSVGEHITPIPYFYLAHALLDADFQAVEVDMDKVQKKSLVALAAFAPVIALGWLRFWLRETRRWRSITKENRAHVLRHLSWPVLVGRTIVVSCRKAERLP
jgi:ubiquinone/menaquinone biosynthesis C-methylase UbiE